MKDQIIVDGVTYVRAAPSKEDEPEIRYNTYMYCTVCGLSDFAQNMARRTVQVTFGNDTRYVITGHGKCLAKFPKHRFQGQV